MTSDLWKRRITHTKMSRASSESPVLFAQSRLAMLTTHLLPSTSEPLLLHLLRLSAYPRISPPANLKGTFTIVGERTKKNYQVEISAIGTVKVADLKKVWLPPHNIFLFVVCELGFQFKFHELGFAQIWSFQLRWIVWDFSFSLWMSAYWSSPYAS